MVSLCGRRARLPASHRRVIRFSTVACRTQTRLLSRRNERGVNGGCNVAWGRSMKRFLGISVASMCVACPVLAADLPRRVAPPVVLPVAFSWTGFYVGGHIGGAWGTKEWDDPASTTGCA